MSLILIVDKCLEFLDSRESYVSGKCYVIIPNVCINSCNISPSLCHQAVKLDWMTAWRQPEDNFKHVERGEKVLLDLCAFEATKNGLVMWDFGHSKANLGFVMHIMLWYVLVENKLFLMWYDSDANRLVPKVRRFQILMSPLCAHECLCINLMMIILHRWASSTRRGGMTVLGKVAVPKPINLPSQRYLISSWTIYLLRWLIWLAHDLNMFIFFCFKARKSWSGPKCGDCTQVSRYFINLASKSFSAAFCHLDW